MHPDNNFNAEILFPKFSIEAKIIQAKSVVTLYGRNLINAAMISTAGKRKLFCLINLRITDLSVSWSSLGYNRIYYVHKEPWAEKAFYSMCTEGDIGGFWTPQYRKKIRQIPQYRKRKLINTAILQYRMETRCHTETTTLYVKVSRK